MGYILHQYVVASLPTYGDNGAVEAIEAMRNEEPFGSLISPGIEEIINGDAITYLMAPDGSKEGWDDSDKGDDFRQRFIDACLLNKYATVAHFRMAGDDRGFNLISLLENGREDEDEESLVVESTKD